MPDLTRDEIEGLAARLSAAMCRALLGAKGSPVKYADDTSPAILTKLAALKLTHAGTSRLTPLGQQVRTLLQEQATALASQVDHAR